MLYQNKLISVRQMYTDRTLQWKLLPALVSSSLTVHLFIPKTEQIKGGKSVLFLSFLLYLEAFTFRKKRTRMWDFDICNSISTVFV